MNIMVQMQAQVKKVEETTVANKKELEAELEANKKELEAELEANKKELVQVNAKVAVLAARPTNPQMGLWCRYSYLATLCSFHFRSHDVR